MYGDCIPGGLFIVECFRQALEDLFMPGGILGETLYLAEPLAFRHLAPRLARNFEDEQFRRFAPPFDVQTGQMGETQTVAFSRGSRSLAGVFCTGTRRAYNRPHCFSLAKTSELNVVTRTKGFSMKLILMLISN